MTSVQIVYWRDIPAQVKARTGRIRASQPLSNRFQEAIDDAAMRAGLSQSDAYLAEWRTSEAEEREGEPTIVAASVAEEIEKGYSDERLNDIVVNRGAE